MLQAGVHFGHKSRYWNPKMAPYIFGVRQDIHIINLEKTLPMYHHAVDVVAEIAAKRGKVLFVGTKYAAQQIIAEEATRCGMPYVNYRWLGGMLTNYKTIRQSIKRLKDLESMFERGALDGLTKKEALTLEREKDKLQKSLGGIKDMSGLPDVIVVIDVCEEKIAIEEANKLNIPVVAVVDTNAKLEKVDHIIPGNDDSARSIKLYIKGFADAILASREKLAAQDAIARAEAEKKQAAKKAKEDKAPAKRKVVTKKAAVKEAASDTAEKAAAPKKPAAKKTVTKKAVKKADEAPAAEKAADKDSE